MAVKGGKLGKKDDAIASLNLEAIAMLLEEHREDLSQRVMDLESICSTLRHDNARLKKLESRSRR